MKTINDCGIKIRNNWANNQGDAHTLTPVGFLNNAWDEAITSVREDQAVVLLVSQQGDLLGTLLPSSYIEEFQRKLPDLMQNDPVVDVSVREFRRDFAKYRDLLQSEHTLMVRDDVGEPAFAVANKVFSAVYLKVNEDSKVSFVGDVAQYMFTDKVYDPAEHVNDKIPDDFTL